MLRDLEKDINIKVYCSSFRLDFQNIILRSLERDINMKVLNSSCALDFFVKIISRDPRKGTTSKYGFLYFTLDFCQIILRDLEKEIHIKVWCSPFALDFPTNNFRWVPASRYIVLMRADTIKNYERLYTLN
jgi:hypothetical protein